MRRLCLLIILLLCIPLAQAVADENVETDNFRISHKVGDEDGEWNKVFDDERNGFSVFNDMIATNDGYLLAGYMPGMEDDTWDGWLVQIDNQGNKIWERIYNRSESDTLDNLVTGINEYIAQGTTEIGKGRWGIWVMKIDVNGNIIWENIYGKDGEYRPWAMTKAREGGAAIVADKNIGNRSEIALLKVDENGEKEWEKIFYYNPGLSSPEAGGVVQTNDGGYAISGEVSRIDSSKRDFWILKTDGQGNELWNKTYGQHYDTVWGGNAIITTSDGGLLANGMAFPNGLIAYAYLLKTDAKGDIEWEREFHGRHRYGEETGAAITAMIEMHEGYILSGLTAEVGDDGSGWLVKIGSQGNEIWNKTFGNMYGCSLTGGVVAADDGYVACGYWNRTAWVMKCGDYPPPKMEIVRPRAGYVYLFDREIMPAQKTFILGGITFTVDADNSFEEVNRVEFYVTTRDAYERQPKGIDYQPPYEWKWNSRAIGLYRIIVAAYYGNAGGAEADEIAVIIFNL